MSEDPLDRFWEVIADVEVGHRHELIQETVFQLAAALRVSRARVAELETLLALSGEATIPYQTTSATHVAALEAARKEET